MSDNHYAFPNTGNSNWGLPPSAGMTLRDWFAGQIAAAMAAELYQQSRDSRMVYENVYTIIAGGSYELADAMLAERAICKTGGGE